VKIRVGASTDVGRQRERNEDSFLSVPPLYAVADGMGGHRGGNVASSLAVRVLSQVAQPGNWQQLAEQVRQANRAILDAARDDRSLSGMGTTLTAAFMEGEDLHLAHVGDSRAYLLRGGELTQLSEDHTLVHRMVQEGKITEEEAEHHPQRSILIRALGVEDPVEVDESVVAVREGDRILLCSDGLYSMVDDGAMRETLAATPDPQEACERLVEMANAAGGMDNITVLVLDFVAGEGVDMLAASNGMPAGEAGEAGGDVAAGSTKQVAIPTFQEAPAASPGPAPTPAPAPAPAAGAEAPAAAAPPPPAGSTEPRTRRPDDTFVGTFPPAAPAAAGPQGAFEPSAPSQPFTRGGAPRKRKRHVVRWIAAVLALAVLAFVGVRLFADTRWFVSEENGQVAVFRGIPAEFLGQIHMYGLVEVCADLPAAQAEKLHGLGDLPSGHTVDGEDGARALIARIRTELAAKGGGTTTGGKQGAGKSQFCG
jgi:PPM family protein phosphatase